MCGSQETWIKQKQTSDIHHVVLLCRELTWSLGYGNATELHDPQCTSVHMCIKGYSKYLLCVCVCVCLIFYSLTTGDGTSRKLWRFC